MRSRSGLSLPLHPRRRLQYRPRQQADPQRAPLRAHFCAGGGSERLRKVINKMVSEQDLIDTVAAAYGAGWRQVKLYFMCGLPTGTDEDVLQIADLAKKVIDTGRRVSGRATSGARAPSAASCPSRTRRSSGRPSSAPRRRTRLAKLREAILRRPQVCERHRLSLSRRPAGDCRRPALAGRSPGGPGDRARLARWWPF